MAQTFLLQVTGSVQAGPVPVMSGGQSLQEFASLDINKAYTQRVASVPSIVGATDGSPFVLQFGTVTKCRFLCIHVLSGSLKAKLTNPTETDQVVRFGDFLVIHAPNPGEEITAVKLVGTADAEILVMGE